MKTATEYNTPVVEFLAKIGVTLNINFVRRGHYFPEDKEQRHNRNIYLCGLQRGENAYSFNFGDSIDRTQKNDRPQAYDVMSCLTYSDPGSFDDFCDSYGYDNDSINALKTYKSILNEWAGMQRIFTNEELEHLAEIAQ